jgi:tripartite-type tricarboxylate transporter receptor subunit TctC
VQLSKLTGIKLVNVPFKGGGETVTALISGNIPMVIGTPASILPHVESGAAIPLVLTSAKRSPVMPGIPGTSDVGLGSIDSIQWFGLFAPAKTPQPIVRRLHAAVQAALADPQLRASLAKEGAEAMGSPSPEDFAAYQKNASQVAAAIIREAGLAPKP